MAVTHDMGVKVKFQKGGWWLVIDHKGQRRSKKVGDRKTAYETAREVRRHLIAGDLNLGRAAAGETFEVVAKRWLESVTASLKHTTVRFYSFNLKCHILPVLGARPIETITRAECRALIAACRTKGLKPASMRGVNRTLSAVLSQAVEDGLVPANPAFRMGRYLRDAAEPPKEIRPLTKAETQRLLALAERRDKVEHAFILAGVLTGMRLGELLGLRWEDLDFKAKFIDVRRSRTGQRVGTPKNGKSRRVDMATALVDVLGHLKAERKRAALAAGKPMSPTVFLTPEGTPLDGDNFRKRVFHRLLEAAGIPRVGLHNLRHTYASHLIQRGESLTYISRQMGHSSIQVTVDIYGHLVPGENRGAVDRLGDWLTEPGGATATAIG